jgi:iron-sulfur cluster assembly accessory protein
MRDSVFEKEHARVFVDPITAPMVNGAKLDFVEELIGSSFQIVDNPNADSSCGCKISFNIKTND